MANDNKDNKGGMVNNLKEEYNLKKAAHPGIILLTLIFKGIPVASYLVLFFIFGNSMMLSLFLVYITASMDYWFVKNISGRILVGLRWYRKIEDNGDEEVIYEHKRDEALNNPADSKFFWGLQYLQTAIWGVLFAWNCITFDINDLMVVAVPFVLSAINLYYYINCSSEQKSKLSDMFSKGKKDAGKYALNKGLENI